MLLLVILLSISLVGATLLLIYKNRSLTAATIALEKAETASGTRLLLASPDATLERLFAQCNQILELRERESRALRGHESDLRRQISNISHDLRTPLTSILGYLQLLEGDTLSQEEQAHYLSIISARAKALQDLITAFYDLSRIDGGEYPLIPEPLQLQPILEGLLVSFYDDISSSGLVLDLQIAPHLPPIMADRGGVERILSNLIVNAIRHGTGTLSVHLKQEEGYLVTQFQNTTNTLRTEDLPHLFDRFYTADQMRTGQNTGLGLAIVSALVKQMGHTHYVQLDNDIFTAGIRWNIK